MRQLKRILLSLLFVANTLFAQESVSLVLQWEHQAQFSGYYMAIEKGFYEEHGLDVTIINGGADINIFEQLTDAKATFCTSMFSEAIRQNKETKLKLVQQVFNRSNFALVAWKNGKNGKSDIRSLKDLAGKDISIWSLFRRSYESLLERESIQVNILPQYYSISLFLNKGVDACSVMTYNEYHTLIQNYVPQEELQVFKLHDYDIVLPEDGIYCLEETYIESPELCKNFSKASMQGWDYAREHPEETLDVVMRYINSVHLPQNRAHMKWMLNEILESIYPKDSKEWKTAKLSKSSYDSAINMLNIGTEAPNYKQFVSKEAQDVEN